MDLEELAIREACRDTIAQYTHAGDRLRLEQLADAFCEDGVLEVRGSEPAVGRRAIIARLSGSEVTDEEELRRRAKAAQQASGERRILRHLVTNIRFESVRPEEARVSSYYTVISEVGLDHTGMYRDRLVPDGDRWRFAHRLVTVDWFSPTSRFARRAD